LNCLGLDGGGSKTICVLIDDTGQVLGRGEGGVSNYQSVGEKVAFCSIQSAMTFAIASLEGVKVEAICLGLAGVARPADIQVAQRIVEQLRSSDGIPITGNLPAKNVVICNDALIALVGGLGHGVGIVAIAGTGSIIFGRNQQGHTKRVGGWGYILGDEGSAYQIAVSGMRAALRADDGRDQPTILQSLLREHLGLVRLENLVEVIYQQGWSVKQMAALAPIVDQAAASGDLVAIRIIDEAVAELVKATEVVIDEIFSPSAGFEVVTTGGVWQGKSLIYEKFAASVVKRSPGAKVIFPRDEPAYGAALLALNTLI